MERLQLVLPWGGSGSLGSITEIFTGPWAASVINIKNSLKTHFYCLTLILCWFTPAWRFYLSSIFTFLPFSWIILVSFVFNNPEKHLELHVLMYERCLWIKLSSFPPAEVWHDVSLRLQIWAPWPSISAREQICRRTGRIPGWILKLQWEESTFIQDNRQRTLWKPAAAEELGLNWTQSN